MRDRQTPAGTGGAKPSPFPAAPTSAATVCHCGREVEPRDPTYEGVVIREGVDIGEGAVIREGADIGLVVAPLPAAAPKGRHSQPTN